MTFTATTLLLVALTIVCTSVAQILQKQAAHQLQSANGFALFFIKPYLYSLMLLALGMLTWLLVLSQLDVSRAYPLLSLNFILVPLLARWKFDEQIPAHRIAGSAIIIAGLFFLFTG